MLTCTLCLCCRLEEEAANQQRMLSDKANAESRMKSLEEKLTLNEDVVTKVRQVHFD